VVDTEDGVDLERLSDLSEGISRLLDTEPDLDDPYHLELTSPGLERKLTRRRHYEKSVGREVSVKVRRDAGTEVLKGLLTVVGDDTFAVNVGGDIHEVAYEAVTSARTVFRWESTPKPGKR
jgi:ribosome maturation factor RimP